MRKKALIFLLVLVLTASLAACGAAPAESTPAPAASVQPAAAEQTPNTPGQSTPAPAAEQTPNTPGQNAPSDKQAGESDPAEAAPARLELFWWGDIQNDYEGWDEVTLTDDEYTVKLAFVGESIPDLTLLSLFANDAGFDAEAIHVYGPLKENVPVVVALTFYGDLPSWGVAYTDADGVYRQFAIGMSGEDGSLLLTEIE